MQRTHGIGDLVVLTGNRGDPGMVVAVIPSGESVIVARPKPDGRVVETVHKSSELKGPMSGKVLLAGTR